MRGTAPLYPLTPFSSVATSLAGVVTLALLLGGFVALTAFEAVRYAEARARIRASRIGR